ncbi:MAG TPA: tyrosine-type recombinase/integrase, partial [Tepidisphaeraceae bacterium]|nr:tyrosine-type recombinase/integrase [Tepidisphaeraceae bacterium]
MNSRLAHLLLVLQNNGPMTASASRFPYRVPGVSVFKRRTRRAAADPWMLSYKDPVTGRHRTIVASADTEVTARQAREISRRIDMQRLGQFDARAERMAEHEKAPLLGCWVNGQYVAGHLDDYRAWMIAIGRTPKQANEVYSRARKMLRLCRFKTILDVTAETLRVAVAHALRQKRNLSLKTCNDYIKAPAQLCRWMCRPTIGRARFNPLADIELYNAATDAPRHPRRALTRQQFEHVLATTRRSGAYQGTGMSGEDRAMYYLVKMHTGFRNEEIASLTPESFDLDANAPAIMVEAAYSKHRRRDVQPILPELAEQLRSWLAGKPKGQRVFDVGDKPYLMWRADLETAGISYRDDDGRFADLYALRHTFATELGRSGASIKTVQQLMRHSDVRLTARYMHATRHDQIQALRILSVPAAAPVSAATGTFGGAQQTQPQHGQQARARQAL